MKCLLFTCVVFDIFVLRTFAVDFEELRSTGELRKACSKRGTPIQPSNRVNTTQRLIDLRNVMASSTKLFERPIDAFIVTSSNEHQNEYVEECDKRREFISGFSGSTGSAVIMATKAALWTDGRYHLQADDQLNCEWLLMRQGHHGVPTITGWIIKELPNGGRVGADPKLIAAQHWLDLEEELKNASIDLIPLKVNPIDTVWYNKPPRASKDVFVLGLEHAGKDWRDKVDEVRKELDTVKSDAIVITALDEIAWLLNIRSRDIPYSPVVRSYLILSKTEIKLFVNESQLMAYNVKKHLRSDNGTTKHTVIYYDYDDIWTRLRTDLQAFNTIVLPTASVYSLGVSYAIYSQVPKHKRLPMPSPLTFLKAVKNQAEIKGMRKAHIRDAAAMCRFFCYLEKRFKAGDRLNEVDLAMVVDQFRFEQNFSLGYSFPTIVAFGPHAALPHYTPTPNTNSEIFGNSTLLIDSGGQYYEGTTDITRTIHLGTPTEEQKSAYTRVLKGCIQFSLLVCPGDMPMSVADVLARAPLWEAGMDYLHGTGHGVGSFLSVHEDPISIFYNRGQGAFGVQTFKPGYFHSVEPGYYKDGDFGIRLENIVEVYEKKSLPKHSSGKPFYGFRDVTLVPYENKLIDFDLLSSFHKRWLNEYNEKIRHLVGAELKKQDMEAFFWMMEKTKYIPVSRGKNLLINNVLITGTLVILKAIQHLLDFYLN